MPRPIEYTVIIKPSVEVLVRLGKVMIDVKDLAAFLGLTPTKAEQLACSDRIPPPLRFGWGRCIRRWSVLELLDWVAAGCPRRGKWVEMNGWSGWARRR